MEGLAGKTVVVTGAARGQGAAETAALARAGASVVAADVLDEEGESLAASLAGEPGKVTGRPGTPEEVASLVLFLLSDQSRYVNGAEVSIDGGYAAHGGSKAIADAVSRGAGQE